MTASCDAAALVRWATFADSVSRQTDWLDDDIAPRGQQSMPARQFERLMPEADLGMFGRTGAPQKGAPQEDRKIFVGKVLSG